jgi:hypothetical protein
VFRAAQVLTLVAAAGIIPAGWLTVRQWAESAREPGVRPWLATAGLAVSTVGFAGLAYVAIVGGLLAPSISY